MLLKARIAGLPIDGDRLSRTLSIVTSNAVKRGHGSEAAWGVWGHILFNLPIDPAVVAELADFDEDIVALVSLDARSRGLINPATTFPLWESNVSDTGLRDGHWLLAYEATVKNWIIPPANPVVGNAAFHDLQANNVTFYRIEDPEALTLSHAHSAPSWMVPAQSYLV